MTEVAPPAVLIDVDGVLNPYRAKPHRRPAGYGTHRLRPNGWADRKPLRVWLHPEHGPMLLDLAERADVELWWCTTWERDANTMIGPPIGLPELPVVKFGFRGSASWKFAPVLDAFHGRPLAWLDDDFDDHPALLRWFVEQRSATPTLLVRIDPRIGLQPADLDRIAEWRQGLPRD